LLGGALSALDHATWNTAVLYTTAANATLLVNTAPLWVALFAWLVLREHLVGLFWVGLALALGGAAAVLGNDFLHPSVVAPTMIGQPVLTALLAIPLLNEGLHTAQLLGGLIVLAGIYLVHRSRES
jgi:drug/metabolite transporter (DMT)-like permease